MTATRSIQRGKHRVMLSPVYTWLLAICCSRTSWVEGQMLITTIPSPKEIFFSWALLTCSMKPFLFFGVHKALWQWVVQFKNCCCANQYFLLTSAHCSSFCASLAMPYLSCSSLRTYPLLWHPCFAILVALLSFLLLPYPFWEGGTKLASSVQALSVPQIYTPLWVLFTSLFLFHVCSFEPWTWHYKRTVLDDLLSRNR